MTANFAHEINPVSVGGAWIPFGFDSSQYAQSRIRGARRSYKFGV